VWIFSRELDWGALFAAFRTFTIDREMLAFAIPQNLNMTLERFITNIDIIMLGMFGVSASTTGFYGAGAMIVRELLTIKQVFSNAFVPHVVRLHRHGNRQDLSRLFSKVSRWTATLVVPALLAVAVLRTDVLRLVSPEFGSADALFMLALLPIPYLQCSAGLAGNIVVMTGHSRLNLLNSTTTALVNTVLNLWLIPALGLLGAALASAVATLLKTAMELVEARVVAGARLAVRLAYPPHVAGFLVGALVAWGFTALPAFDASLWARLATLGGALLLYAGLFAALSGRLPLPPLQATPAPEVPDG
jgi:O-antigen/teichoic acid export membrane protein